MVKKVLLSLTALTLIATTAFGCPGVEGCKCDVKDGDHSKCNIKAQKSCSDCKIVDGKKIKCQKCLDKEKKNN